MTSTTCNNCHRPLTPKNEHTADHPGTISAGAYGMCSPCYKREHAAGNTPTKPAALQQRFTGICTRCGVPAGERRHPLCIDCRAVLTAIEVTAWAA